MHMYNILLDVNIGCGASKKTAFPDQVFEGNIEINKFLQDKMTSNSF